MENVLNLGILSNEELKEYLWKLTYDPISVMQSFSNDISMEKFIGMVVAETRNENRNLHFAEAEPVFDTLGVDLGIKNPIVRDVLIERCYKAVFEEEREVEKIIKLLKTEDDGSELSSRRFYGGLKAMGFGNDEANYIKETCSLYPVSLLLMRLVTNSSIQDISNVQSSTDEKISTTFKVPDNTKVTTLAVIENEENIIQVLDCVSKYDITNLEQVTSKIEELKVQIDFLQNISNVIQSLSNEGITLEYVISKREAIEKLFELKKNL